MLQLIDQCPAVSASLILAPTVKENKLFLKTQKNNHSVLDSSSVVKPEMTQKSTKKDVASKDEPVLRSPTKIIKEVPSRPATRKSNKHAHPGQALRQTQYKNLAQKKIDASLKKPQSHFKGGDVKVKEAGSATKQVSGAKTTFS